MDARVKRIISIMRQSVGNQLSSPVLSKSVGLSPGRLRQLFQRETGRSPMEYLREVRMRRAELLLRGTFLSVKEIAFAIGAKHVSSFVHAFKRKHGLTPSEFRAQDEPSLNGSIQNDSTSE
jgi:transcriptional regulator GlxA family with amidase domain